MFILNINIGIGVIGEKHVIITNQKFVFKKQLMALQFLNLLIKLRMLSQMIIVLQK
jgi:hypothetical protein